MSENQISTIVAESEMTGPHVDMMKRDLQMRTIVPTRNGERGSQTKAGHATPPEFILWFLISWLFLM